ncbi:MAG: carboxypeptidase-like regulatory domain-containing protein [Chthoniobacter sp.]|nr:carboxypeptidase-like regulatory domain-containing protein [Chthoniobacter sp.]
MKTFLLTALSFLTLGLAASRAQDDGSLPFPVSVGGQAATYKKGEPFAKLAKPVKNDAPIDVTAKADQMIIINVHKTDAKGAPVAGAQPAIILLQNTNKGSLAGTMDKQKLAAGDYLLSVVAEGKTSSILFKIE